MSDAGKERPTPLVIFDLEQVPAGSLPLSAEPVPPSGGRMVLFSGEVPARCRWIVEADRGVSLLRSGYAEGESLYLSVEEPVTAAVEIQGPMRRTVWPGLYKVAVRSRRDTGSGQD